MAHLVHQTVLYKLGEEEQFLKAIEVLDIIELKGLLQSHREKALTAGKRLASAFTAAASSGFLLGHNFDNGESRGPPIISDGDSDTEDTAYEAEDDSSIDEDDDDSTRDEYLYASDDEEEEEDGSANAEDRDDSTFVDEDADKTDEDDAYSIVDDDVRALVGDFHDLLREILEHNSALCLIQFALNGRGGKGDDGPSLIRAMLPWTFSLEDRDEADSLLELDGLSVDY